MDEATPSITDCINFLARLHHQGAGYSSVNAARSALSAAVSVQGSGPVGDHPLVKRLLRGVYLRAPPTPRYSYVWDVNVVLDFLRNNACACELDLKHLTMFTVVLLLLVSGQRCQTLAKLDARGSSLGKDTARLRIRGLLKTSRPGASRGDLVLQAFPSEPKVCVVTLLGEYMSRTAPLRGEDGDHTLFISYTPPHKEVGSSTIGRWAKQALAWAGVDTTVFSAHSTRAATASAAKAVMPIDQLVQGIGWASARTFARFYDKPVCERGDVGEAILRRYMGR